MIRNKEGMGTGAIAVRLEGDYEKAKVSSEIGSGRPGLADCHESAGGRVSKRYRRDRCGFSRVIVY